MEEKNLKWIQTAEMGSCDYRQGSLPACAPLASALVPMQGKNSPKYNSPEALTRGTLFPGLDLPFMNTVNKSNPYAGTPLGDLMALDFTIKELNLYLDTHPDDTEAFEMLKSVIALAKEGHKKFVKMCGPLTVKDLEYSAKFDWLDAPWPWEYAERTGKE